MLELLVPLTFVLNLPKLCGLVRFTTAFGLLNQGVTGMLCASTRSVNRARSPIDQVLESEYWGQNKWPAYAVLIPKAPGV